MIPLCESFFLGEAGRDGALPLKLRPLSDLTRSKLVPLESDFENVFGREGFSGDAVNGFGVSEKSVFVVPLPLFALPGLGMAAKLRFKLFKPVVIDGVSGVRASFRERLEGVLGA